MPTVPQALLVFEERFAALLDAAQTVRIAIEASAGVVHAADKITAIQDIVAEHFGFTRERMLRRDRHAAVALARQVAMTLCRECTNFPLERIAHDFGGYDHGTVIHAEKTVAERRSIDEAFARSFALVRGKVYTATTALPAAESFSTMKSFRVPAKMGDSSNKSAGKFSEGVARG